MKMSKKIVAIMLSVLMVTTTLPMSVFTAFGKMADGVDLSGLQTSIENYYTAMDGTKIYKAGMVDAYDKYIQAQNLIYKAKYGCDDNTAVTSAQVTSAKNALDSAITNLNNNLYTVPYGSFQPSKAFSEDTNLSGITNNSTSTVERYITSGTGNDYNTDVYGTTYQNLLYADSSFDSTISWNADSNCTLYYSQPSAVILYTGDETVNGVTVPFKARVGSMVGYKSLANNKPRIVVAFWSTEDDFQFGPKWYQCANTDGDSVLKDTFTQSGCGGNNSRWNNKDFTGAIAYAGPTDKASGTSTDYVHGSRCATNEGPFYMGNYLEFQVASGSAFNKDSNYYHEFSGIDVSAHSGGVADKGKDSQRLDGNGDYSSNSSSAKFYVINYSLLRNALSTAAGKVAVTAANPRLSGGLRTALSKIEAAASYVPTYSESSYNAQAAKAIADEIAAKVTSLSDANLAITADKKVNQKNIYSELARLTADRGREPSFNPDTQEAIQGGEYYYAVNNFDDSTDESVADVIAAYYYAQYAFDHMTVTESNNTRFLSGAESSTETISIPAKTFVLREDDPATQDENEAYSVTVPAATKNIYEIYNMIYTKKLQATNKVDTTLLELYIETVMEYLEDYSLFSLNGSARLEGSDARTIKNRIVNQIEPAIWKPQEIEHENVTYEINTYPTASFKIKDTPNNQTKVDNFANEIYTNYIAPLRIWTTTEVAYNGAGDRNSLTGIRASLIQDYVAGDYANGRILQEAYEYVASYKPMLLDLTSMHDKLNDGQTHSYIDYENNRITAVYDGIIGDKIEEYKAWINYCKGVIDSLVTSFLTIPDGTILQDGTQQSVTTSSQTDKKFYSKFTYFTDTIVLKQSRSTSATRINLKPSTITFTGGDCLSWGAGINNQAYQPSLDAFNIDDTQSACVIAKHDASFMNVDPISISDEDKAKYAGKHTVNAYLNGNSSNPAVEVGIANVKGVESHAYSNASISAGSYDSFVIGFNATGSEITNTTDVITGLDTLEVSDSMGCLKASGETDGVTKAAGNMYIMVPGAQSLSPESLTRTTVPAVNTYVTKPAVYGDVVLYMADGAAAWGYGFVYNGYNHNTTGSTTWSANYHILDISTLKALYDVCMDLSGANYTAESWQALCDAEDAAGSPYFGDGTQTYKQVSLATLVSELEDRYEDLYDAYKGLRRRATVLSLCADTKGDGINQGFYEMNGNEWGVVAPIDASQGGNTGGNQYYMTYTAGNAVNPSTGKTPYTTKTWAKFAAAYEAAAAVVSSNGKYRSSAAQNFTLSAYKYYQDGHEGDNNYLSPQQQEINNLVQAVKTTYAGLKGWADFSPIDSAYTALKTALNKDVYTREQLNAVNTMFSGLTTSYYKLANDAEAQGAIDATTDLEVYNSDDNAAIAAEAAAISAVIPAETGLDVYTAESVMAQVSSLGGDPDEWDVSRAVSDAQALANDLTEPVAIDDDYEIDGTWNGYKMTQAQIDARITEIISEVSKRQYTVKVKDSNGNYIEGYDGTTTYPYGTKITLNDTSPADWKFNYTSATVKNHKESVIKTNGALSFVVVGNMEYTKFAENSNPNIKTVRITDNLNNLITVDYLAVGATLSLDKNNKKIIVTNYDGAGATKEIALPERTFYNITGFLGDETVTDDMTYRVDYTPVQDQDGYVLTVYNASTDEYSQYDIGYNERIQIDPVKIVEIGTGRKRKCGEISLNTKWEELDRDTGVADGETLAAMTVVEGVNFRTWLNKREEEDPSVDYTEVPFKTDTKGEYTTFASRNIVIVLYQTQAEYNQSITKKRVLTTARTDVEPIVYSNTKFTMHGKIFLPGNEEIVECGMLMYLGNNTISADDLTLTSYGNLPGAYRLKYTKSTEYNNINVSVATAKLAGKTINIRYRSFVTYKSGGETYTMYSPLAESGNQTF